MTAVVRRAAERGHAHHGWLEAWHSFNFGAYMEPGNTHHGVLILLNDDTVAPGHGFDTHPHRDLEIVTWPIAGRLMHRDSTGCEGELWPGRIQQMTAGSGVTHSEHNASDDEPARWVQMWMLPDERSLPPRYQDVEVDDALAGGALVPLVGRLRPDALIDHHQRHACLWAGRLDERSTAALPEAPFVHLYVVDGAVELEGVGRLEDGDAVRLTHDEGERALACAPGERAELLAWEMHATLSRAG